MLGWYLAGARHGGLTITARLAAKGTD